MFRSSHDPSCQKMVVKRKARRRVPSCSSWLVVGGFCRLLTMDFSLAVKFVIHIGRFRGGAAEGSRSTHLLQFTVIPQRLSKPRARQTGREG